MQLSLFYFASETSDRDGHGSYRLLLDGARFADHNGFAAVWMPERHFHPFGGIYPNPSVTAAAVATVTENVALRAGSVVAPLHHPIRIAEEWSVVDNLSGGRVGVSFASGWHPRDFVLAPGRFADRKADVVTAVETVRALWRGDEVAGVDGHGEPIRVSLHPKPVSAELPVWITTSGNTETFELAGRLGARILTHATGQDASELGRKAARYRQVLAEHHPSMTGHVTLMLHTFMGEDVDAVRDRVREPLTRYLRSSFDLRMLAPSKRNRVKDSAAIGEREVTLALRRAADRYFDSSGLFGPPDRCVDVVHRFAANGIDEIGCLVDYGPSFDDTMTSLELLAKVRDRV